MIKLKGHRSVNFIKVGGNMPYFEPGYLQLYRKGVLKERMAKAEKHLVRCRLCPHECGIDRTIGMGFCRTRDRASVSSYGPHFGEEDVLVGYRGSGTIFFANCNMRCVYCQNYEISFCGRGKEVTNEELAEIMLRLQNDYRCHNINLVTPTHVVPNILAALNIAVQKGLRIPLVYNTSGYERIETLKILDGIIDIYMPDFKYWDPERGRNYSKVANYSERAKKALIEMDRQVGGLKVDDRGIAYRGLLIRHLVLPGGLEDTKKILRFIRENLSPDCLVNVMGQYFPAHQAYKYEELNRRITYEELHEARTFARELGLNLAE